DPILELMCGTGRVSLPLLRAGCHMTCVDYSGRMLDVFRSKLSGNERVRIIQQDITGLELNERFDLAFIPFHSIAEIILAQKRAAAIARIYDHLNPGGAFFLSLYNPAYRIRMADGAEHVLGSFIMPDSRMLKVRYCNEYVPAKGLIRGEQAYEIRDKNDALLETRRLDICFSVVEKEEVLLAAQSAGFTLKQMYGDYARNPYTPESMFMHFLFERPAKS
ncbi:MAG: class I SAM-dependent methyltransferase, partial [Bacillota bacterium]